MSFSYDFKSADDTVYFAYCFPYTLTKLQNFLKGLQSDFLRVETFFHSLTGISVPLLTITDNVANCPKEAGAPLLITDSELDD